MTLHTSIIAVSRTRAAAVVAAAMLAACGGGDVKDQNDVASDASKSRNSRYYSVGGTVTYSGPVDGAPGATLRVIAGNGTYVDETVPNAAGTGGTPVAYTFQKAFTTNQSYRVAVVAQPDYLCTLTGVGSGVVRFGSVSNADFFCQHIPTYPLRFEVRGLPSTQSVTVAYSNVLAGVEGTMTVSGSGIYTIDERFGEGASLTFGVAVQPTNYGCNAPSTITAGPTAPVALVACSGKIGGF
jgi:hypothetical protein